MPGPVPMNLSIQKQYGKSTLFTTSFIRRSKQNTVSRLYYSTLVLETTEYDFRSAQGFNASADHALGRNLPSPSQYNLDDEAVRPGTSCGRISTAYPLSEFDIIVNRAAKLPSPMEETANDDSMSVLQAFGFLQSPVVYGLGRKAEIVRFLFVMMMILLV